MSIRLRSISGGYNAVPSGDVLWNREVRHEIHEGAKPNPSSLNSPISHGINRMEQNFEKASALVCHCWDFSWDSAPGYGGMGLPASITVAGFERSLCM